MVDTCSESEEKNRSKNQKVLCDGWQSNQGNNGSLNRGLDEGGNGDRREVISRVATESWELLLGAIIKSMVGAKTTKKRTTYKTSKRILLLRLLFAMPRIYVKPKRTQNERRKKLFENLDPKKIITKRAKKKTKLGTGQKKARSKKKENQKNFNSFRIHSINIILDMVFLCTLYIFKGTHTRSMDCGVKKVCEGLKHRMVRTSSTVRCFRMGRVYAPTNGNRKKSLRTGRRRRRTRKIRARARTRGKINSSTVRILLKANRKKLYIQTYRCVYISFSAWALNDVIAGIRVNPKSHPSPCRPRVEDEDTMMEVRKTEKNSRINKKRNMCTVQCKRSICSLFNFASIGKKETTHNSVHKGAWERVRVSSSSPFFRLEQRHIRNSNVGKEKRLRELSFLAAASHAIRGEKSRNSNGTGWLLLRSGLWALLGW